MITTTSVFSFHEKGVRENNEDFVARVNDHYFVVCDGMGGHGHGEIASQTVAESLCAFFQELRKLSAPADKSSLQASLDFAVERLNAKDVFDDEERKMGTTTVLAALTESSVLTGHVGDSRLYHIREGEGLLHRTLDHSQVQEWIDAEIITEEEARTHPKKNIITRCVQPKSDKPAVMEIDELVNLQTGDYLFLCTDGVTDAMTDDEIVATILSETTFEEKGNKIKEICAETSKDNFSGFLLQLEVNTIKDHIIEINTIEESQQQQPAVRKNMSNETKQIQCASCGMVLTSAMNFCPNCGKRVCEKEKQFIGKIGKGVEWMKNSYTQLRNIRIKIERK